MYTNKLFTNKNNYIADFIGFIWQYRIDREEVKTYKPSIMLN